MLFNNSATHTHRIAVNAYLINDEKFLLLKRANPPRIWTPPGGKLHIDENPEKGLQRETLEETSLNIIVIQPVTTWFGKFEKQNILSIDYLCTCNYSDVHLSKEHTEFKWLRIEQLLENKNKYFNSSVGFKGKDFQLAWNTYKNL